MLKIEVTQEDIDNGSRNHSSECPLALAIKRATGKGDLVKVWRQGIGVDGWWGDIKYAHSAKSTKFYQDFDQGKEVKPSTFTFKEVTEDEAAKLKNS